MTPIPRYNKYKVQAFIDRYSGGKSPLSADYFINLSEKYAIPLDLMLAQAAQESAFGTKGRAVRTKNMFNIGNFTPGDKYPAGHPINEKNSTYMGDWERGAELYAKTIKNDYLKGKTKDQLLDKFVNYIGNPYATNPVYGQELRSILRRGNFTNTLVEPNPYVPDVSPFLPIQPPMQAGQMTRRARRLNSNTAVRR